MINKKLTSLEQLDRLTDSLVNDIIELSDEEILEDAKELFENPSLEIERLKNIINTAVLKSAKGKLTDAKNKVNAYKRQEKSNVIPISITQKRAAIQNFLTKEEPELKQKLTLAARKGEGIETENDIEGMFEDMLELGLIDENGNPK